MSIIVYLSVPDIRALNNIDVFLFTGTSRERRPDEMNGSALYHFVSEGAMKAEINAHRYIEFGKHKQHLYGIKVDSVLEVIESGRMCVLDVNPQVCTNNTKYLSLLF